jgi:hypothetical protein
VHDIARAARTYGVRKYYVVTPLVDQITLVHRLIAHWTNGAGAAYNPQRGQALKLVQVKRNLAEAVANIRGENPAGGRPRTVVTSARSQKPAIGFADLRRLLHGGAPYLLVFGTAWGLPQPLMAAADFILEPLKGPGAYNHLSVRSAAAAVLDRLMGDRSDCRDAAAANLTGGSDFRPRDERQ